MSWNHENVTLLFINYLLIHVQIPGIFGKQRRVNSTYLWAVLKEASWQSKRKENHTTLSNPLHDIILQIVRQFYAFKLSSQFQKKMTENHLALQSVTSNPNHL